LRGRAWLPTQPGQNPGHAGAAYARLRNGRGGRPPFFVDRLRIDPLPFYICPGFCPVFLPTK
jgi:hypothetical protein